MEEHRPKRLVSVWILVVGALLIGAVVVVRSAPEWSRRARERREFWEKVTQLQRRLSGPAPLRPDQSAHFNRGLFLLEVSIRARCVVELRELAQSFPQREREAILYAVHEYLGEMIDADTTTEANRAMTDLCARLNELRPGRSRPMTKDIE